MCRAHGGGRRCALCGKSAAGSTDFCGAHGGGRRCQRELCTKTAVDATPFCRAHGGGRRCQNAGCSKSAVAPTQFCIAHGGGKRCNHEGCTKSAQGASTFCIAHGGGRRCLQENCCKGARRGSAFCRLHSKSIDSASSSSACSPVPSSTTELQTYSGLQPVQSVLLPVEPVAQPAGLMDGMSSCAAGLWFADQDWATSGIDQPARDQPMASANMYEPSGATLSSVSLCCEDSSAEHGGKRLDKHRPPLVRLPCLLSAAQSLSLQCYGTPMFGSTKQRARHRSNADGATPSLYSQLGSNGLLPSVNDLLTSPNPLCSPDAYPLLSPLNFEWADMDAKSQSVFPASDDAIQLDSILCDIDILTTAEPSTRAPPAAPALLKVSNLHPCRAFHNRTPAIRQH